MGKKEFTATALDPKHEIFVVHIASLNSTTLVVSLGSIPLNANVHSFRRLQISRLIAEEALTKVSTKYLDFADVFSPDLASKLLKHIRINDHAIELVDGQQPSYEPIYSLGPVELETLKAYIKTNPANGFIKLSKFPASTPILFD